MTADFILKQFSPVHKLSTEVDVAFGENFEFSNVLQLNKTSVHSGNYMT